MPKINEYAIEFKNPGSTVEFIYNNNRFDKIFLTRDKCYKKYFNDIYFYTFDRNNIQNIPIDKSFKNRVLYNKQNLHSIIYAFLTPIFHYKILKQAKYYFATRTPSSLYPIYNSFFFKNKKVIIYWNYDWIEMAKKINKSKFYILFVKFWTYLTLKLCKNYIVTNQTDKTNILKYKKNANILILPSSIDNTVFKPLNNIEKKPNTLLFVGRLTYQKNLDTLIKVVSELKNIELHIVGEGELRKELEKLSKNLIANVIFHGSKNQYEIVQMLNKYSLFILPSYTEGISNALVEAMACKIPVIASNIYTTAEIIQDKYNGILCETDRESIKSKIEYAINHYDNMIEYAENAYQMVLKDFTVDNYFKKVSEFVKEL